MDWPSLAFVFWDLGEKVLAVIQFNHHPAFSTPNTQDRRTPRLEHFSLVIQVRAVFVIAAEGARSIVTHPGHHSDIRISLSGNKESIMESNATISEHSACTRTLDSEGIFIKLESAIRISLMLLGVVTNILTIHLMKGALIRQHWCTAYILTLMIVDTLVLLTHAFDSVIVSVISFAREGQGWTLKETWHSRILCGPKILGLISRGISLWIIAALGLEGSMAAAFPFQHLTYCTLRKARVVVGIIIASLSCAYIPSSVLMLTKLNVYTSKLLVCGTSITNGRTPPYLLPYLTSCEAFHRWSLQASFFHTLLTGLGPIIVLLLGEVIQLYHLWVRNKVLHLMNGQDKRVIKRISEQNAFSKTLLVLIAFRAIVTLPYALYQITESTISESKKYLLEYTSQNYTFKIDLVLEIAETLSMTGHVASLVLLISSNNHFWQQFSRAFRSCGAPSQTEEEDTRRNIQVRISGDNKSSHTKGQPPCLEASKNDMFPSSRCFVLERQKSSQSSRKTCSAGLSRLEVTKEYLTQRNSYKPADHQTLSHFPTPLSPGGASEEMPGVQEDNLVIPSNHYIGGSLCPIIMPTELLLTEVVVRLSCL